MTQVVANWPCKILMFCTRTGSSRIGHTGELKSKDITKVFAFL